MSKKSINGLEAFRKLENIDTRYLSEADAFISLTEDESVPVGEKRSLRERFAFTQTGWFAAAVSAVVALGAVVFIIRAGGSAQPTVNKRPTAYTPASNIGESAEIGNEAETPLTAGQPEDFCSSIYAYGKNDKYWNDLTDEEKAQARKVHVKQGCHIFTGVGGTCVVCGIEDDSHIHVYNGNSGTCMICGLVDTATDCIRSCPDGWEGLSDEEKAAVQAELASIRTEAETTVTRSWADLTDEEKEQLEEAMRNHHSHVYNRNGGECVICGWKDGSYEYCKEYLPFNHQDTAEEKEKAALIAAYFDELGLAYGRITYNDYGLVVTLPQGPSPKTHYDRSQLELQGYRIESALESADMPVKENAWWVYQENEYGCLSNVCAFSGEFVRPPLTHNASRDWSTEELEAIVSDVFGEELEDGWRIRFAQMEDKDWLNVCFEIDETMTVGGDRLSLLMNEVWRRMDKSVAMISVYFCYPGDTDTRADFFIDYTNGMNGGGSNEHNIECWQTPSVPYHE